jgi:hypothetical protein
MVALQESTQIFETVLNDLAPDECQQIVDILKSFVHRDQTEVESSLVRRLTGRSFSRAEKIKLELHSLLGYFERRRELLDDSLTASEVADLLGTSRQTSHDRLKNRTLLGVLDRGAYRFPSWQFDAEGPDGVIEGFPEVLRALNVSDFAKLNWLVRPNPILDGLTPIAALKQGLKERVIQEALGVGVL